MRESEAKSKRAAAGRAFKDSFMKSWRQGLADKKNARPTASTADHADPWKTVAQNIGSSAGDYRGQKDVTRMREAIINRVNHK